MELTRMDDPIRIPIEVKVPEKPVILDVNNR